MPGVVRDGARALVLCAPLLAVLVARGRAGAGRGAPAERVARGRARRSVRCCSRSRCCPAWPWASGHRIQPADYPAAYDQARRARWPTRAAGDVLVLPLSSYRAPEWNHRHLVLDPVGRYLAGTTSPATCWSSTALRSSGEDPRVRGRGPGAGRADPTAAGRGAGPDRDRRGGHRPDRSRRRAARGGRADAARRPRPAGRGARRASTCARSRPAGGRDGRRAGRRSWRRCPIAAVWALRRRRGDGSQPDGAPGVTGE